MKRFIKGKAPCDNCGMTDWVETDNPSKVSCFNCGYVENKQRAKNDPKNRKKLRSRISDSKEHENEVAGSFGGRVQEGSGNNENYPGDVVTDRFLIECKKTDHQSKIIRLSELEKISKEARRVNKIPFLSLKYTTPTNRRFVIIEEHLFKELIGD